MGMNGGRLRETEIGNRRTAVGQCATSCRTGSRLGDAKAILTHYCALGLRVHVSGQDDGLGLITGDRGRCDRSRDHRRCHARRRCSSAIAVRLRPCDLSAQAIVLAMEASSLAGLIFSQRAPQRVPPGTHPLRHKRAPRFHQLVSAILGLTRLTG